MAGQIIGRGDFITWNDPLQYTMQQGGNVIADRWRIGRVVSVSRDGLPTKVVDHEGRESRLFSAKLAKEGRLPQHVGQPLSTMDVNGFLADVRDRAGGSFTFDTRDEVAAAAKEFGHMARGMDVNLSQSDRVSYLNGYRAAMDGQPLRAGEDATAFRNGYKDGASGQAKFMHYRRQELRPNPGFEAHQQKALADHAKTLAANEAEFIADARTIGADDALARLESGRWTMQQWEAYMHSWARTSTEPDAEFWRRSMGPPKGVTKTLSEKILPVEAAKAVESAAAPVARAAGEMVELTVPGSAMVDFAVHGKGFATEPASVANTGGTAGLRKIKITADDADALLEHLNGLKDLDPKTVTGRPAIRWVQTGGGKNLDALERQILRTPAIEAPALSGVGYAPEATHRGPQSPQFAPRANEAGFLNEARKFTPDQAMQRYMNGIWSQDQYEAYMHAWSRGKVGSEAVNWQRTPPEGEVKRLAEQILPPEPAPAPVAPVVEAPAPKPLPAAPAPAPAQLPAVSAPVVEQLAPRSVQAVESAVPGIVNEGSQMALSGPPGGGLAGLGASWPEVLAARRARAAQIPGQLGMGLETARAGSTPGGALVPWQPDWRIIDNPGGNFEFGRGVPNSRSIIPATSRELAVPSLAGQQAEQLALGAGPQQLALSPGTAAGAAGPSMTAGAIPLGPASQAVQTATGAAGGGGGGGMASAAASMAGAAPIPGGGTPSPTQTSKLSGLGKMLAYTPFNPAQATGTMFGPGSLGRAGGYALAGTLASNAFDALVPEQDGAWDDAASNALQWGGTGAGIGSMIAPGIGTAIGGGIGAVLGGGYSLLTGGTDSAPTQVRKEIEAQEKRFGGMLAGASLSPEAQIQIRNQLNALNYGVEDKNIIKQNYQQVAQILPALGQQEAQQKRQLSYMLAMQNYLAPQYDQFLQRLGADKQAFTAANNELANQVGGANGAYIKAMGAKGILSDAATNAAYKAQLNNSFMQQAGAVDAPRSIVDALTKQYG